MSSCRRVSAALRAGCAAGRAPTQSDPSACVCDDVLPIKLVDESRGRRLGEDLLDNDQFDGWCIDLSRCQLSAHAALERQIMHHEGMHEREIMYVAKSDEP
jgi:hypothetical protein